MYVEVKSVFVGGSPDMTTGLSALSVYAEVMYSQ